jgi:hypothetical protein
MVLAAGAGTLAAVDAGAASCGGFENPCSHETSQQFGYGSVQRQDTPNDPNYDQSEPDTQQPPENRSSNFYDERFDLFGFPSELTPGAIYSVGTAFSAIITLAPSTRFRRATRAATSGRSREWRSLRAIAQLPSLGVSGDHFPTVIVS